MERKNKEKSKSFKIFTNLNIISTKQKKDQNVGIQSHLKSGKLGYLAECDFTEKVQKLFDSNKFSIGNQFDQEGSEKFLAEKDECLKCMDLDYTILEKKKLNKNEKNCENKRKTEASNLLQDIKYSPQIKNNKNNEFIPNLNE